MAKRRGREKRNQVAQRNKQIELINKIESRSWVEKDRKMLHRCSVRNEAASAESNGDIACAETELYSSKKGDVLISNR